MRSASAALELADDLLEDVLQRHQAHQLAEDLSDAGGGMHLGGDQLHQRGLAGAIGAEHDPTLVLLDAPVHGVEQRRGAPAHAHAGELEYGLHESAGLPSHAPQRSSA